MRRSTALQILLTLLLVGTISLLYVQDLLWSRRLDVAEERIGNAEKLLADVAMPRYPNARLILTMPDGRQGGMPLLQITSGELETHGRRTMHHWNGPDEWGDASSGGYFWRYIGSEADRDIYEFVIAFGKRLPAKPDETVESSVVRYVSYRNSPISVVSQNGISIAIAP